MFATFSGRRTGLQYVRGRLRGQLRRRVQRVLATGGPTVATHVRAVTAFASARASEEVHHDDGQPGTGHEQPSAEPQPVGKRRETFF